MLSSGTDVRQRTVSSACPIRLESRLARRLEILRVQKLYLEVFAVAKQDDGLVKTLDKSQVAKRVVACSVRNINTRLRNEDKLMYQLKARDSKA